MRLYAALLAVSLPSGLLWAQDSNWPQWRGPERNGVSKASGLPLEWGERILWKTLVEGRGHSSPIVWGDRVFVTSDIEGDVIPGKKAPDHLRAGETYSHPAAQSADRRHTLKVLSLDAGTGEILWARTAHDGPVFDNRHRRNTYATPTAVTRRRPRLCLFRLAGSVRLRFRRQSRVEGRPREHRYLGARSRNVPAALRQLSDSPSRSERRRRLLSHRPRQENRETGVPNTSKGTHQLQQSHPRRSHGRHEVITTIYKFVVAYDAANGKELWRHEGFIGNAVPTPVANESTVFVTSGYPDKLTRAIRIPQKGRSPKVLWEYKKGTGYTPSSLLYGDYLYLVSDKGILTCLDPETGRVVYEGGRIPVATFVRASPVAWEDKILLGGEDGDFFVIRAGATHEVLSSNSIRESVTASPAIAGGKIFLRSESHLYAIGAR